MEDNRKYLPEIIRNIRQIDSYKIILVGSYASGVFSIISESGSSFYNEIKKTGKVLYEKTG